MTFGHEQQDFWRNVPDAPAQAISTRLKLWLGEWFLDITDGTPYQTNILGVDNLQNVDPVLRERILETEGVDEIISLDVDYNADNRHINVSAVVSTIYGQQNIEVII